MHQQCTSSGAAETGLPPEARWRMPQKAHVPLSHHAACDFQLPLDMTSCVLSGAHVP